MSFIALPVNPPKKQKKQKKCIECGQYFSGRRQEWCRRCDTIMFIKRADIFHNGKYDYSSTVYIGSEKKVKIICPVHGLFLQLPGNHLRYGCVGCGQGKHTNSTFATEANKIHSKKYDYSNVDYVGNHAKVEIICRKHGTFFQEPAAHLSGTGCPACGGVPRYTTETYIQKAKETHGDTYLYDQVQYVRGTKKIKITCKIHGVFQQSAKAHLRGQGCPGCFGTMPYSSSVFIEKARTIHGSRYDYSKSEYINTSTKLEIICKEHGHFFSSPNSHLGGHGCPACSGVRKSSTKEFIRNARVVHGTKYRYDKVKYYSTRRKVMIGCKIHGYFEQAPGSHLSGQGCVACGGRMKMNTSAFIEKARDVHGNTYDYSQVDYANTETKVKIICKKHGPFFQRPHHHLNKHGCTICGRRGSRSEKVTSLVKKTRLKD